MLIVTQEQNLNDACIKQAGEARTYRRLSLCAFWGEIQVILFLHALAAFGDDSTLIIESIEARVCQL